MKPVCIPSFMSIVVLSGAHEPPKAAKERPTALGRVAATLPYLDIPDT